MDLTQGTDSYKQGRAKKMMLWFGIISMAMMFAGLTSAYVVSKSRPDWVAELDLPSSFLWSTIIILLSSITLHFAERAIKKDNRSLTTTGLLATLGLSVVFIVLQFYSFNQLISEGFYFTGSESNITTSFIYIVVLAHLAHLAGGMIVLLVIIYNHFKQRYHAGQTLGLELGATYWHFVDALWIYLFLFLYFFR
ncbi:MAG: cytochrome c oxidase subunit 3 [Salinimicrobium sediminis]|uniref:Cytochrome c oxidase subunit 3 n=1 Tax=Salinimicrobium sediminis TaxID=1343891 RepID=A0A285X3K2_9FLAO|nr:cytochrome c oxidase subunit 3 [Salinimicrobium sediminis]MDX1602042.1 cytochrome c oxidase subunit 3 [Salinimicrobium sediminis]SOC78959.1 cytochrome c oxidase subunit 3 [Salinimicrobium sediminis]